MFKFRFIANFKSWSSENFGSNSSTSRALGGAPGVPRSAAWEAPLGMEAEMWWSCEARDGVFAGRRVPDRCVGKSGLLEARAQLDQVPLQMAMRVDQMQPALARSGGATVEGIDKSLGQADPCNSNPLPPPGQ